HTHSDTHTHTLRHTHTHTHTKLDPSLPSSLQCCLIRGRVVLNIVVRITFREATLAVYDARALAALPSPLSPQRLHSVHSCPARLFLIKIFCFTHIHTHTHTHMVLRDRKSTRLNSSH